MSARLVVVSDSHLGSRAPESVRQWESVLRFVASEPPDLVVHAGDLSLDGAHRPDDLAEARHQLDRLDVPWRAVPGNHDVGDNPRAGAQPGSSIDISRVRAWREAVGPDWWSAEIGGWRVVGINAQLLATGLDDEERQWRWLATETATTDPGDEGHAPTMLVSHKPIAGPAAELARAPSYRYLPGEAARRLDTLLGPSIELVVSGHVHQHRELEMGGRRHAWAPSTWAVLPDHAQEVLGAKRCGVLSIDLSIHGARATPVEPEGIRQLTIGTDIPNPYDL